MCCVQSLQQGEQWILKPSLTNGATGVAVVQSVEEACSAVQRDEGEQLGTASSCQLMPAHAD